jgi:hypothetical protein
MVYTTYLSGLNSPLSKISCIRSKYWYSSCRFDLDVLDGVAEVCNSPFMSGGSIPGAIWCFMFDSNQKTKLWSLCCS